MRMQKTQHLLSFLSVQATYSFEFASKLRLRNSSILWPVCCSQAVFSASNARLFSSSSRTCCSNERRICSCLLCNYFRISRISTLVLLGQFTFRRTCVKTPRGQKFALELFHVGVKKDLDRVGTIFLSAKFILN